MMMLLLARFIIFLLYCNPSKEQLEQLPTTTEQSTNPEVPPAVEQKQLAARIKLRNRAWGVFIAVTLLSGKQPKSNSKSQTSLTLAVSLSRSRALGNRWLPVLQLWLQFGHHQIV